VCGGDEVAVGAGAIRSFELSRGVGGDENVGFAVVSAWFDGSEVTRSHHPRFGAPRFGKPFAVREE